MTSIHDQGKSALDAFEALPWPAGAACRRGPAAGRHARFTPDCVVVYPCGTEVAVELKKSTTSTAQLRPLDYHTTVVWRQGEGWWVLPPQDVMLLALRYVGQHCTSSFECFNPGKPNGSWTRWHCLPDEVPQRVLAAHRSGLVSPLRDVAVRMAAEIRSQWEAHKAMVRAAADVAHG